MTLKDELRKLYKESANAKKKEYFDTVLPRKLIEAAMEGKRAYIFTDENVVCEGYGITLLDILEWCKENDISHEYHRGFYPFSGEYCAWLKISWL